MAQRLRSVVHAVVRALASFWHDSAGLVSEMLTCGVNFIVSRPLISIYGI
jgi:hypothetical protein